MACSPCSEDERAPAPQPPPSNSLEALYQHDLLFARAAVLAASEDKADLVAALEALEATLPTDLSIEARIKLQNDLWGVHERAQNEVSDPELEQIANSSARLARRVAPDDIRPLAPPDELPEVVAALGVVEQGTEMPILSHEASCGFRRVFRVAMSIDGARRVLFSQLVAFDRSGRLGVTHVIGEVEHLIFRDGALVEARVWKRHDGELHEVDAITHIPSLGADSFFLEESTPLPLSTLPCLRCHEDDDPHSLPRADLEARPRWQRVLNLLEVPSVGE